MPPPKKPHISNKPLDVVIAPATVVAPSGALPVVTEHPTVTAPVIVVPPTIDAPAIVIPPPSSTTTTTLDGNTTTTNTTFNVDPVPNFKKLSSFPTINIPTSNIDSTTTAEQDLRSAGQRRINYIWEYTQAGIAVITVGSNILYIFILLFIHDVSANATNAATLLANAFFLVIGFYFGRTNHARMGGESGGKNQLS